MTYIPPNKIEGKATALLDKVGIKAPAISVDRIAKALDATIEYSKLENALSGLVFLGSDRPIIGINSRHHKNRQRFSIAHEIGHIVLHAAQIGKDVHVDRGFTVMRRDTRSAQGIDVLEIQANRFAAALLMPRAFLEQSLQDDGIDIDDEEAVADLAKTYAVSRSAMQIRLASLFT
ncbi:ImmA/IrrE family metallo-endopeptidase [Jannaschia rubra]|uniref:ImmA/IrrE family metallo-endopeptidase n=1 Tax=Jannaschia rubra TaxID=282197 RepID=UPI0006E19A7E|nr:ImmA/IrrE family metallo-endopeptidase [Jannaschia rubra]